MSTSHTKAGPVSEARPAAIQGLDRVRIVAWGLVLAVSAIVWLCVAVALLAVN